MHSNLTLLTANMAKIVIAGEADCPLYAKVEALADTMAANLPHFQLHKIVKLPGEWSGWLEEICQIHGFDYKGVVATNLMFFTLGCRLGSPLIWRELIDRGGRGFLIGGPTEFNQYIAEYYGVSPDIYDDELAGKVAEENLNTLVQDSKEMEQNQPVKPVNICITNSSTPLAYQLCSMLCSQQVCGSDIQLTLLDSAAGTEEAEGVALEVMDMCSNHVRSVVVTNNATEAFQQAAILFILDQFSSDTDISTVAYHYHNYAKLLDSSNPASNTKVIVYGFYSELAVSIMVHYSNCLKRSQFCSSHYFTEQQVKSLIGNKLNINPAYISGVAIWGGTVDLTMCTISQYEGAIVGPPHFFLPLNKCLFDTKWLEEDFFKEFSLRSSKNGYKDSSPCVAEATSLLHHIQDWINGSDKEFHSVGIVSDGSVAAITDGLCVCVPTHYSNGVPVMASITISDNINSSLITHVNELTQLYQKALSAIG